MTADTATPVKQIQLPYTHVTVFVLTALSPSIEPTRQKGGEDFGMHVHITCL